jgi:hypothetical protein
MQAEISLESSGGVGGAPLLSPHSLCRLTHKHFLRGLGSPRKTYNQQISTRNLQHCVEEQRGKQQPVTTALSVSFNLCISVQPVLETNQRGCSKPHIKSKSKACGFCLSPTVAFFSSKAAICRGLPSNSRGRSRGFLPQAQNIFLSLSKAFPIH